MIVPALLLATCTIATAVRTPPVDAAPLVPVAAHIQLALSNVPADYAPSASTREAIAAAVREALPAALDPRLRLRDVSVAGRLPCRSGGLADVQAYQQWEADYKSWTAHAREEAATARDVQGAARVAEAVTPPAPPTGVGCVALEGQHRVSLPLRIDVEAPADLADAALSYVVQALRDNDQGLPDAVRSQDEALMAARVLVGPYDLTLAVESTAESFPIVQETGLSSDVKAKLFPFFAAGIAILGAAAVGLFAQYRRHGVSTQESQSRKDSSSTNPLLMVV